MSNQHYQGTYQGSVLDSNDPERRGRVKCLMPQVLGNAPSNWCEPMTPTIYNPPVGEIVWVQFIDGDITRPIYLSRPVVTSAVILAGSITQEKLAFDPTDGTLQTFYSETQPVGADVGDLWYNTTLNAESLWRFNGTIWQRILDADVVNAAAAAATAQATADGKIVTFSQPTPPTAQGIGDFWVDTDDSNKLYRWDGSTWVSVRDAGIAQAQSNASSALANAATAQATADGKVRSFFQTTAPTGMLAEDVGDLWFDTDNGYLLYRWSGSAWVESADTRISTALSNAANAQATADGKITTWYQAAAPTAEGVGDLWVDTDDGNRLYRWSGSAWVSVVDAGIATAQSTADTALTSANGKNKITWSTSAASGSGVTVGDIWFQRDGAGTIIGQWEWSGTSWFTRIVSETVIGNLSAGKIVTGTLNADRIGANTISADKLLVGIGLNSIANPGFEEGSVAPHVMTGASGSTFVGVHTTKRSGLYAGQIRFPNAISATTRIMWCNGNNVTPNAHVPAKTGDVFVGEMWVRALVGTPTIRVRVWEWDSTGVSKGGTEIGLVTTTTYQQIRVERTVLSPDTRFVTLELLCFAADAGNEVLVDDMSLRSMVQGDLIVNGAIDGKTITGATIQTEATALRGVKIDSTGIKSYSGAGVETVKVNAADGLVTLRGIHLTGQEDVGVGAVTPGQEPPLRIGTLAGQHMRMDGNEVQAMSTGSAAGTLHLNAGGGQVNIGLGGGDIFIGGAIAGQDVQIGGSGGLGTVTALDLIKAGKVSVNLAVLGTVYTASVTFGTGFPTQAPVPNIVVTPEIAFANPGLIHVGTLNISRTGFSIKARKDSGTTGSFDFHWIAVAT